MNNCYLNLLSDFQASLFLSAGANLADSKQTADVILPNMSLLGYVVPVESLGLGLFVCLLVYFLLDYNSRLQSHENISLQ